MRSHAADVDWSQRLSWGSPAARTTSRFFTDATVKKRGRVFYDYFFLDGKRVALHDCVGVALRKDDPTGEETSRLLELWEDTKGSEKGHKYFRGRWLFYPHHLPEDHKEATRKRTGLDARQVYEQCDSVANDQENPLASVRTAQRVLCCWKDSRNRLPSEEELQAAHAWFDSAWDDKRHKVVPLHDCVDKEGSERFALLRAVELVQPPTLEPASGEAVAGARSAVAATSAKQLPEAEKVPAVVPKAPAAAAEPQAAAAELQAASAPQPAPKAVAASAAPARVAPPKTDAAAKPGPVAAPPPAANAAPTSRATLGSPAASGRCAAAPSRHVPAAAEKRSAAAPASVAAVDAPDKLPSLAGKHNKGAALGTKPALPVEPPAKKPASAGDKRPRQEEVPAMDEVFAKRVAKQPQPAPPPPPPPPPPSQPFRIPKTKPPVHNEGRPAAPATLARAAGGALTAAAFEGPGPTLTAWTGQRMLRDCLIIRVSGLPFSMQHSEWKSIVKAAKLKVLEASVNGWVLPSNMWQGSGTGFLLVDRAFATATLKQLNGMSLRCAATGLLRPLFADICDASELTREEPLIGHLQLGDGNLRGRDPIVPHFVQSNTLELDMSLQWRALITTQFSGRQGLRSSHVQELTRVLRAP